MAINVGTTIEAVRLAMQVEDLRARVAANNIAMANVPGSKAMRVSAGSAMENLKENFLDTTLFSQELNSLRSEGVESFVHKTDTQISLDSEVADVSAASTRYRALADGVSRQFALMQLAIRGGR